MNTIINLSDKQNSVTIAVEDKEFIISKVVIKANEIYGNYMLQAGKYMQDIAEYNKNIEAAKDEETVKELSAELEDKMETFIQQKKEYIESMMKILLEKNGYEYDCEWWDENADYKAREQFIETVLTKDNPGKKKESLPVK